MLNFKRVSRDQAGFTLVEIAIVMVIIGLLIGGVLKGQAMIESAKVKRTVKMTDELRAAMMTFYDKFGVYPGDNNLTNVPPGHNGTGNGNGQIAGTEIYAVYRDLSQAGLISGTYNGTSDRPKTPYGGNVDLIWVTPTGARASHYFRIYNLPAEACIEIDTKNDDGVYNTGSIIGSLAYTAGTNVPTLYILF